MQNNKEKFSEELAIDLLQQIPTPVMAVDTNYNIIFINKAGEALTEKNFAELKGQRCYDVFNSKHCKTEDCRMRGALQGDEPVTVRNEILVNGASIPIEYTAGSLRDAQGNIVGGLEYILDITERVRQEERLREQSRTIMEISTPAIKLWDRIVVLPVVGVVDSLRAQQMMNTMLEKIMEISAKVIILDIQGVAAVDTAVANHLIKVAKATRLMGCQCIISGISPAVAETLVQLGIDLGDVSTNSTLQDALSDAFALNHLTVTAKK
ncbi:PAS domain-containing protein [Oleidesulfovibrio sp.]|uniref:PAS domain-containing protein n=1 Tax=Oleidesulfovibrio sp. TaxID=2909707 RepID=UPI003A863C88